MGELTPEEMQATAARTFEDADRAEPILKRESSMSTKRYTQSEIITLGQERYERDIRATVEGPHKGKMLALDVDSGEFALGDDSLSALDHLQAKAPDAPVYLLRVGFPTAVQIGNARSASKA